MDRVSGGDLFAELKSSSEEYAVYDSHYERIGKVDDVLVDELDRVTYVGVKMGLFGTNSTLIPVELVRVNDKRHLVEVAESKETIKHAPHFGQDETVSPELEDRVRTYFGLEPLHPSPEQQSPGPLAEGFGPDERVDVEPGERAEAQDRFPRAPAEGEIAPSRPRSEETAGEPADRWEESTSEGGVRVHRKRF